MAPPRSPAKAVKPRRSAARAARGKPTERLVPLHYQAYMVLRRRLLQGEYDASASMPGELQLAAQFKVSRVTIRRTLARLEDEGLVVRRHGIGTFPGDLAGTRAANAAPLGSLRERLVGPEDERRNLKLVAFGYLLPPPFLRGDRLAFGRRVLRVQRVSFHGARPAHFVTSYVPGERGPLAARKALGNLTVLEVLEKAGAQVGEAEVTITAAAADAVLAGHLRVSVGAPLLVTQRLTLDQAGLPLEYFEGSSRPDEYAFQFVYSSRTDKGRPPLARVPG